MSYILNGGMSLPTDRSTGLALADSQATPARRLEASAGCRLRTMRQQHNVVDNDVIAILLYIHSFLRY